jgi:PIN domain nuclease of toxin-antitoxin system
MRVLLDTHLFLWLMMGDSRLNSDARLAIDRASEVYVSLASLWEVAIKHALGKVTESPDQVMSEVLANGYKVLQIDPKHIFQVAKLPHHHNDPFDRLLLAQAMTEPLILLTSDRQLQKYSELVVLV